MSVIVNLGISPYPIETATPRAALYLLTGDGWGTIHETHWHWGTRACPRGGDLLDASRIQVTSVLVWAI